MGLLLLRQPRLLAEDGAPVVFVPARHASAAYKNTWLAAGSYKRTACARSGNQPGKQLAGTCTLGRGSASCLGDEGSPVGRPGRFLVGGKLLPGELVRGDVVAGLLEGWKLVARVQAVVVSGLSENWIVVAELT